MLNRTQFIAEKHEREGAISHASFMCPYCDGLCPMTPEMPCSAGLFGSSGKTIATRCVSLKNPGEASRHDDKPSKQAEANALIAPHEESGFEKLGEPGRFIRPEARRDIARDVLSDDGEQLGGLARWCLSAAEHLYLGIGRAL